MELVYIQTDKLSVTITGKVLHNHLDKISTINIYCLENFKTTIEKIEQDISFSKIYKIPPLFYEQQNYEIIIEKDSNSNIEFWHENLNIRNKVNNVGHSGNIISGIINFGNEIGNTELIINIDNNVYMKIQLEIFPSKLRYQEDYINIMTDITDEIYNIAFEFMKKTYSNADINNKSSNSFTEFFSIIKIIYDKFINSIDIILKNPHHILKSTKQVLPAYKIRHINNRTIKWLVNHPEQLKKNSDTQYDINKALCVNKQVSYDTTENRFVKFILYSVLQKLKMLCINYSKLARNKDTHIIKHIYTMIKGIEHRLKSPFFSDINDFNHIFNMSLVFTMASGYKELYRYYLMLLNGLSLHGDIFRISVKDLALIYEYWCFIKINSIIKSKYQLIKQDILYIDNSGLFVTLKMGKASRMVYEHNGDKIELLYNPASSNLPTVSQRPDIVLSVFKKSSNIIYKYIFDSKYKINNAYDGSYYKTSYITPGPDEEDINTMHRYRDALVYENQEYKSFERVMFGAYVLFPYDNEEEYKEHKFYKSIEKVNIGGLPFLPNSISLVSQLIYELIDDFSEYVFERAGLPVGIYDRLRMEQWNKEQV